MLILFPIPIAIPYSGTDEDRMRSEQGRKSGNMEAIDLGPRYQELKPVLTVPGSTQVFEGFDTETQQKVSIKVVKAIEDVGDAKRALREMRCMRVLKHTNIQGIIDVLELA